MSQRYGPFSCGLDAAVSVVGGKWKPLVIWSISERQQRFGELRRGLSGVSEKMLAQQLRELERDGIVKRETTEFPARRVTYSLTELGRSLNAALDALGAWGAENMIEISERRSISSAVNPV